MRLSDYGPSVSLNMFGHPYSISDFCELIYPDCGFLQWVTMWTHGIRAQSIELYVIEDRVIVSTFKGRWKTIAVVNTKSLKEILYEIYYEVMNEA